MGGSTTPVNVSRLASGVAAITAGYEHSCTLTRAGGVKCWGSNYHGKLGDGTTTDRHTPVNVSGLASGAIAISASDQHTCALTGASGAKCWGRNVGMLGDGTTTDRLTPVATLNLVTLMRARARFTISTLAAGVHSLSAVYGGDTRHSGSTGATRHVVAP